MKSVCETEPWSGRNGHMVTRVKREQKYAKITFASKMGTHQIQHWMFATNVCHSHFRYGETYLDTHLTCGVNPGVLVLVFFDPKSLAQWTHHQSNSLRTGNTLRTWTWRFRKFVGIYPLFKRCFSIVFCKRFFHSGAKPPFSHSFPTVFLWFFHSNLSFPEDSFSPSPVPTARPSVLIHRSDCRSRCVSSGGEPMSENALGKYYYW